ncbi:MAG TPA: hypothetical protein VKP58_06020 [Candidatus Acidoferrum sp.]|nr:hypothetical protein [Candidatus Acidoferrum sp.]
MRRQEMAILTNRTIVAFLLMAATVRCGAAQAPPGPDTSKPVEQSAGEDKGKPALPGGAPNGKKLILKDGDFQLVREYTRNGERVRYYSLERADWEEIPASMIDWVATQKAEAATSARDKAELEKLKKQEEATRTDMALDVDASLQTASGMFLPSGEGMFAVEGKKSTLLEQAGVQAKRDKKQILKQIASPIPIVPSKTNIELPGGRAKARLDPSHLEFYLREAPPDPDQPSTIQKSSRPGESGPEVELVRATVKGNKRVLEEIRSLFGEKVDEARNTVLLQRWEVAPTVFRFTLGEALTPGEYALAEILPDGINLYVWDFGVDGSIDKVTKKK